MKKNLITVALLAASAFVGVANAAGTISFNGSVVANTCNIDSSSAGQTLTMGAINTSTLANVGDSSPNVGFEIILTNCPATVTGATVQFNGTPDADEPDLLALTSGAGVATGVAVGLYEDDGVTSIAVNTPSVRKTLTSSGPNTLGFVAKYVATGPVGAGTANAVSNFVIDYN